MNTKLIKLFEQVFNERKNGLLNSLESCLKNYTSANFVEKESQVIAAFASDLNSFIRFMQEFRPDYLVNLLTLISNKTFFSREKHKNIVDISEAKKTLEQFHMELFTFDNIFDFESAFQKAKEEEKIDELFEKIVNILQRIVDQNLVHDNDVLNGLKSIIANLGKQKNESFTNFSFFWNFVKNFVTQILIKGFEAAIGIDLITPLKDAINETDTRYKIAYEQAQNITKENIKSMSKNKDYSVCYNYKGSNEDSPQIGANTDLEG